jgi:phosphatidate cytidylyltransferase
MLRWRLLLGSLIIAALAGLCWLDANGEARGLVPGVCLLPLAMVVCLLATQEMLKLLAAGGMRPIPWVIHLANLLLVASEWPRHPEIFAHLGWDEEICQRIFASPTSLVFTLGILTLAVFLAEICRYRKAGGAAANIAGGMLALVYVGVMLRTAVSLRMNWGVAALASWIVVVKLGDTGAYIVGRLIGRHKIVPLVSPGKTLEGALGSLGFSCLGAWLMFQWILPLTAGESLAVDTWWRWLAFGLLVGAAGMLGDLAESVLKRDAGRKDSSDWLPGFGGVLDLMDSLLLSAPIAWFCWAAGLVGR